MEDVNKGRRQTMWAIGIIFLLSIPAFALFGKRHFTKKDFATATDLRLTSDASYNPRTGQVPYSSIDLHIRGSRRTFRVPSGEYTCINDNEILENLKKGDVVDMLLLNSHKKNLRDRNFGNGITTVYGLSKDNKEFYSLSCTNSWVSNSRNAGMIAGAVAALVSFFFAAFLLKPKKDFEPVGWLPAHPVLIAIVCWIVLMLGLK